METESFNADDRAHEPIDYAGLVRDVQYLKAAVATLAERLSRQGSLPEATPLEIEDATRDDEDQAILAYLHSTRSPAECEETRRGLDTLAALIDEVAEDNGLTEAELADRYDAARRSTTVPQ